MIPVPKSIIILSKYTTIQAQKEQKREEEGKERESHHHIWSKAKKIERKQKDTKGSGANLGASERKGYPEKDEERK